jgi:hypothetical protein
METWIALTSLGTAFRDLKLNVPYYPTVGMKKPGETVRVNFGQEPFAFDIDKMVQDEKAAIQTEITRTKTEASVLGGEDALIHRLVGQYLAHDGYVETARAFSDEIVDEARALANDEEADIPYRTAVEDLDALNRQSTYIQESMDDKTDRIQKYVQRSSRAILTKRSSIRVHTTLRSSVTTKTSTSNSAVGNSSR